MYHIGVDLHKSHRKLAFEATTHCLTGCGFGDVLGVIIGTTLKLPYIQNIILGIILGFILGYAFGIYPLVKSGMKLFQPTKIVATTETLSILVMETGEALTEWHFPGLKSAGLTHFRYWAGLIVSLTVGFVIAFPLNWYLVKRGVRHIH